MPADTGTLSSWKNFTRRPNAAVSLDKDFKEFTREAGVDVLSFGGTKNGMMFGEAVIFFNTKLSQRMKYVRKQGMQLHSKMRFISAQFEALLADELWKENARHCNRMAKQLEAELKKFNIIKITRPVEVNSVFAIMPPELIPDLQNEYFFYVWNERLSEVRLMCSFDTTQEDIDGFINTLKRLTEVTMRRLS